MDERPRPDIDHIREALRRHDEHAEEPVEEESPSDDSSQDEEESPSDDSDED